MLLRFLQLLGDSYFSSTSVELMVIEVIDVQFCICFGTSTDVFEDRILRLKFIFAANIVNSCNAKEEDSTCHVIRLEAKVSTQVT